ncbi:putative acetyltransferase [Haladaptatus litoreus]|uniref:Putative acetyltransferase n=1 Tax=Haladaptatus litoreus TaxID=553468 RepID=A0A1N6YP53_9EURY|nr:GNAT family N-acetyltransferase [Haladaptatus litoreus]SIR16342.1 putative acetyltransferase [Haladaptatus litoreus]
MASIRPATEADAKAILDLHVASIRAFGPERYRDEQVEAWATKPLGSAPYRESVRNEFEHIVVAEVNGQIAGFGRLDYGNAVVDAVYVHPDFARDGVGSALLSHLESKAAAKTIDSLSLRASLNAVPFYEQAGYERVETLSHETTGGVELACVEMTKNL